MMVLFDDEQLMKRNSQEKSKVNVKDSKIFKNDILTYFSDLLSEDIGEMVGEILKLV